MRISSRTISKATFISGVVALIAACGGIGGGGGGGGSTPNYEGDYYLEVERNHIDSGDLNKISVEIANLNPRGAILKFRMSRSLSYVRNTAVRFPDREERRSIAPDRFVSDDSERFLVFFLDPREAIGGDYISLQFTLKGVAGDEDGFLEIDLDNNDPSVPDSREFSIEKPNFTAKDRRSIYIEPDSSTGGGTPTPVASGTTTPAATGTATGK